MKRLLLKLSVIRVRHFTKISTHPCRDARPPRISLYLTTCAFPCPKLLNSAARSCTSARLQSRARQQATSIFRAKVAHGSFVVPPLGGIAQNLLKSRAKVAHHVPRAFWPWIVKPQFRAKVAHGSFVVPPLGGVPPHLFNLVQKLHIMYHGLFAVYYQTSISHAKVAQCANCRFPSLILVRLSHLISSKISADSQRFFETSETMKPES